MLPWACRRPRAGSYSQVAIVAASVQPHVAYGSGSESLTRSKSGLHYLRWQTSISAVKISQSGQSTKSLRSSPLRGARAERPVAMERTAIAGLPRSTRVLSA
jgi:hypothetical protein